MPAPAKRVKRKTPKPQHLDARKRNDRKVCSECGRILPKPKKQFVSARRIFISGILQALELGPATSSEIESRIGFTYTTKANGILPSLERRGLVRRIGKSHQVMGERGPVRIMWALVEKRA